MTSRFPAIAYGVTLRAEYPNRPGMLGRLTSAIGNAGGDISGLDLVFSSRDTTIRDITVNARDVAHGQAIVAMVRAVPEVKVVSVSDPTFLLHLGGKIEMRSKTPVRTRNDLSMAYTPGVARVCMAIYEDPRAIWNLTTKSNTVAVVTDGTAVLGLGDIGPAAGMPVMEGKAMLFKELAGVDAWPICLDTKDPDEIVETVKHIATGFGGINLEDISAPRCFAVEERLRAQLDIPVFHDDQHGTAVVALAALYNSLKIVGKRIEDLKTVIVGVGAGGTATARLFKEAGMVHILGFDRTGVIHRGRDFSDNSGKRWLAENTNPGDFRGSLREAMEGTDLFVGLSGPGVMPADYLKKMNRDPIVFAMANPDPEIFPEEAAPHVRIMGTGRSDYPNQINNALCFPGFFRGLLDCRAREVNNEMKLAAARAIASAVPSSQLNEENIMPSIFDSTVARSVARAVVDAAHKTRVAQRSRRRRTYGVGAPR
ncbi:MAG: NAD-dependent malic enzyme [Chloroflexi bacterium]|nr:NAD-dependent malic enzyme [Chloroflexota bacterium]